MNALTLITPTSDRPQAFLFCEQWMQRAMEQFDGEVQWIVADDGIEPVQCNLGQVHVRNTSGSDRRSSFLNNLLTGLQRVQHDKILFIEDDDWYAPQYLNLMNSWLEKATIVGEARARYYNVETRRYRACNNRRHASLCQTGIRSELVTWVFDYIAISRQTSMDIHMWRSGAKGKKQLLSPATSICCGIKGMPGKRGIGVGHRLRDSSKHDSDGSILNKWVGNDDADQYLSLFNSHSENPTA